MMYSWSKAQGLLWVGVLSCNAGSMLAAAMEVPAWAAREVVLLLSPFRVHVMGRIARLDAEPSSAGLQDWQGHKAKVVAIAPVGSRVYSLGSDGSIRGWLSACPTLQNSMMRYVAGKVGKRWPARGRFRPVLDYARSCMLLQALLAGRLQLASVNRRLMLRLSLTTRCDIIACMQRSHQVPQPRLCSTITHMQYRLYALDSQGNSQFHPASGSRPWDEAHWPHTPPNGDTLSPWPAGRSLRPSCPASRTARSWRWCA